MEVTAIEDRKEGVGGEDDGGVEEQKTPEEEDCTAGPGEDESTDLKLCSMRCQDCGQQFTRWEAFKTHLRMHVLEEDEEESRQQSTKTNVESISSPGNTEEESVPEKRQKTNEDEDDPERDAESSDVDVDGIDDDNFESSWQDTTSEIIKVRPRVAMLSAEEKPDFANNNNRVYACSICGKMYSYLESFRNHQKMHENEALRIQEHKCPDCGKAFVRPSLLLAHLKVHRAPVTAEPANLTCEQCNKTFNSLQTWMVHEELHKQKPFWCLACAKGFKDEILLDKHLQSHTQKRHQCDVCFKSFRVPAELRYHYNTHTGDKPYKCALCKKNFSQLGNLITHRKKHVGVYVGTSKTPLGKRKINLSGKRNVAEMKKLIFTNLNELVEFEGEEAGGSEKRASGSAVASESSSEESGSESSESKFESESDSFDSSAPEEEEEEEEEEEPDAGKVTAEESNMGDGKQNGDWECFECGKEFDQEAELHMHYMKHASGELPVY